MHNFLNYLCFLWIFFSGDYPLHSNIGSREEEESVSTSGSYRATATHLRKRYGGRTLMY